MRIVIISDTHRNYDLMNKIKNEVDADLYLHAGDSGLPEELINPYLSVKGNCDFYSYPKQRIISLTNSVSLYITHGVFFGNQKKHAFALAKRHNCKICVCGHTHIAEVDSFKGIVFVNPGSLEYPRSKDGRSYAIIDIDKNDKIDVKIIYLDGDKLFEKN